MSVKEKDAEANHKEKVCSLSAMSIKATNKPRYPWTKIITVVKTEASMSPMCLIKPKMMQHLPLGPQKEKTRRLEE
jgi:hypothetical protein